MFMKNWWTQRVEGNFGFRKDQKIEVIKVGIAKYEHKLKYEFIKDTNSAY